MIMRRCPFKSADDRRIDCLGVVDDRNNRTGMRDELLDSAFAGRARIGQLKDSPVVFVEMARTLLGTPAVDSGLIAYPRGAIADACEVASHSNVQLDIDWTFHLRSGHGISEPFLCP